MKRGFLLPSLLGLGLLTTAALGGGAAAATKHRTIGQAQVGVYVSASEIMVGWDPSTDFSNEIIAMNNMYETLLRYNPVNGKFTDVLATSYSSSPNHLTWTFHIRKGVYFHSGDLMTAADVKASIERTIQLGQGASYIWGAVKSISVPNEWTVVFQLKYPSPLNLIAASPYGSFIFDTKILKQKGQNWFNQQHEDGTGPYEMQSYSGGTLVLKAFPKYWGGWKGQHFQKVIFENVNQDSTRAQMIESGQADYVDVLSTSDFSSMKNNPNVRIDVTPSFQDLIGFFNTQQAPFTNVKVRQALFDTYPGQQVVSDVMHGMATVSHGPVPVGLWGHDASLPAAAVPNLAQAKRLLAEAGYAKGFTTTLTYTAGDQNEANAAALWAAEAAKVGVHIKVQGMPWTSQWSLAKSPSPSRRQGIFLMYWWPDYTSPYSFLYNMFHSEKTINFNMSYFYNSQVDHYIDQGNIAAGVSIKKGTADFQKAQQLIMAAYPVVPMFDEKYERAISSHLVGFVDNPSYPNVVFWYNVHERG